MAYIISARISSVAYSGGLISMSKPLYVDELTDELINGYIKGYLSISPPPDLNQDGVADPTPPIAPNEGMPLPGAEPPVKGKTVVSLFQSLPDVVPPTQTFQDKDKLFPSQHVGGGQRF